MLADNPSSQAIVNPDTLHVATNPPNQIVAINAATQLPLKLNKINYPSWRVQYESLLFGYDLDGYFDGTLPCPEGIVAPYPIPHIDYGNNKIDYFSMPFSLLFQTILSLSLSQLLLLPTLGIGWQCTNLRRKISHSYHGSP